MLVLLALVNLPMPFSGDQALSTVMARGLGRGDVLYADAWDLRQPGIFLFFLAGGSLLGYREIGIHLFEAIYLTAFAVVLQVTLRGRFAHREIASLVPLATVGAYWAAARSWDLTQIEILVAFPLYVAMWAAFEAGAREPLPPARRQLLLVLAGLSGAAVVILELLYLPIVVAAWAIAARDTTMAAPAGDRASAAVGMLRPVLFGLSVPLLASSRGSPPAVRSARPHARRSCARGAPRARSAGHPSGSRTRSGTSSECSALWSPPAPWAPCW